MGFFAEVISDLVFDGILSYIEYPGAWMHWRLKGRKQPFKQVAERYYGINLMLSLLIYAVIGIIIWKAIELF